MKKLDNRDIQILARNTSLNSKDIAELYKDNVYSDKETWIKSSNIALLVLGIGFMISGIIFFFAYNWDNLNKFAKLGITQALVIAPILIILFSKLDSNIKKIILTAASLLVGVLFAVFGQIYQTGANAYDFFLAWTIFVTIWAFVANFAPLWILYFVLINTTIILFQLQVARDWSFVSLMSLLFIINLIPVSIAIYLRDYKLKQTIPSYFIVVLGLASIAFSTIGIIYGIMNDSQGGFVFLIFTALIVYTSLIWYSLTFKRTFFIALIPFCLVLIICSQLLEISAEWGMILLICIFIIISTTQIIKFLNKLNSNKHEN